MEGNAFVIEKQKQEQERKEQEVDHDYESGAMKSVIESTFAKKIIEPDAKPIIDEA